MIRTIVNKAKAEITGTNIKPRRSVTVTVDGTPITFRTRLVNPAENWTYLKARPAGHTRNNDWKGERVCNKPTDEIAVRGVIERVLPNRDISDEDVSAVVTKLT